jgi:hypothetical protein
MSMSDAPGSDVRCGGVLCLAPSSNPLDHKQCLYLSVLSGINVAEFAEVPILPLISEMLRGLNKPKPRTFDGAGYA